MLRPVLSVSLTILCGVALPLEAQFPARPTVSPTITATPAATPSPSPAGPLDALSEADLQQALDFIKKNYVTPARLTPAELERATLAGLIDRLGRGVTLLNTRAAKTEPSPAPLYHEIIGNHIGYLRPGALRKNDLADLDSALRNFAGKKVDAIVLDLRAADESQDYATATEFAKRFVPKGGPLFALRGPAKEVRVFTSERSPDYAGFIIVLIDRETAGAAEVLGGVLRARDKAILIGEDTAGGAVGYSDLPLPEGMTLRVATEEAVMGDQRIGFPSGLQPDLPVAMPLAQKREIFSQSLTKGMAQFVFETDRPHLNEAALLAGTNPEIEAIQSAQARRARGEKPPLHDPVVQRAVDVITSIGIYEKKPERSP
jgi:hypothetical protein